MKTPNQSSHQTTPTILSNPQTLQTVCAPSFLEHIGVSAKLPSSDPENLPQDDAQQQKTLYPKEVKSTSVTHTNKSGVEHQQNTTGPEGLSPVNVPQLGPTLFTIENPIHGDVQPAQAIIHRVHVIKFKRASADQCTC